MRGEGRFEGGSGASPVCSCGSGINGTGEFAFTLGCASPSAGRNGSGGAGDVDDVAVCDSLLELDEEPGSAG